jgi:hypothetical protein
MIFNEPFCITAMIALKLVTSLPRSEPSSPFERMAQLQNLRNLSMAIQRQKGDNRALNGQV